jgi:ribosomal protein L24E
MRADQAQAQLEERWRREEEEWLVSLQSDPRYIAWSKKLRDEAEKQQAKEMK